MLLVYTRKTDRIVFFIAKAELISAFSSLLQLTVSIISDSEYRHCFWSRANIYRRFFANESVARGGGATWTTGRMRVANVKRSAVRVSVISRVTERASRRAPLSPFCCYRVVAEVRPRVCFVSARQESIRAVHLGVRASDERFTTRGRGQRIAAAMCRLGGQRGMTGTGDNGTAPC